MKKRRYLVIVGIVAVGVLLSILFYAMLSNHQPAITSLEGEPERVPNRGACQIVCNATDTDGDDLSYEWTSTGGDIAGTGEVVKWTAPGETGEYDITVLVTDGRGGSDARTLSVTVVLEQPQYIEGLLITKDRYGHCYLKEYSEGYYVGKEQKYDIECIVADTGIELYYEWSSTGGELSGEGPVATWTAPNTSGEITIGVVVSDIAGNMVSKNMILKVVSCSTCTFGSCTG